MGRSLLLRHYQKPDALLTRAPILRVLLRRPAPRAGESVPSRARVVVRSDTEAEVFSGAVDLDGPPDMKSGLLTLRSAAGLPPGIYRAEVSTPEAP